MIKIDKNKVQVRYITCINKCMPNYPTSLDVLYDSCVDGGDGNLFSIAKIQNTYDIEESSAEMIVETLVNLGYIVKNNSRYKIIKTPWD